MIRLLKKLFCRHELVFVKNVYGDLGDRYIPFGHKRIVMRCRKCGRLAVSKNPIKVEG